MSRGEIYLELLLLRDLGAEELVVEDLELELNGIATGLRGAREREILRFVVLGSPLVTSSIAHDGQEAGSGVRPGIES